MGSDSIDIAQFVKLIEEKGTDILEPKNLPEKWLLRLSSAAVAEKRIGKSPPLAIRIAVLSLKEKRAVKERDVPKREKKYEALDLEEAILRYCLDLELEALRRR